jgi:hypothetical protein
MIRARGLATSLRPRLNLRLAVAERRVRVVAEAVLDE